MSIIFATALEIMQEYTYSEHMWKISASGNPRKRRRGGGVGGLKCVLIGGHGFVL